MTRLLLLCTAVCFIFFNSGYSQGISISENVTIPDNSAILDVSSTSKGTLITRMTTGQRDAIAAPAEGLMIFNSSSKCFEYFAFGLWQTMSCAVCPTPATPAEGTHSAGQTSVTWNWNAVSGATGYKYNTVNNYSTATDNGNNLSYAQSGLNCSSDYTLFVWAYNACGSNSLTASLTQSTPACVVTCDNFTVTHTAGSVAPATKTITYGTVSTALSGATQCWITQNLGADNAATAPLDNSVANAGWRWQFNRAQGYANGPSPAWTITSISEVTSWISANDPCKLLLGSQWRIPTSTEWANASSTWTSSGDSYSSVLKVHAAGFLEAANGSINCQAWCGMYWAATQMDNTNGFAYYNGPSWSMMTGQSKARGHTLRCLK